MFPREYLRELAFGALGLAFADSKSGEWWRLSLGGNMSGVFPGTKLGAALSQTSSARATSPLLANDARNGAPGDFEDELLVLTIYYFI